MSLSLSSCYRCGLSEQEIVFFRDLKSTNVSKKWSTVEPVSFFFSHFFFFFILSTSSRKRNVTKWMTQIRSCSSHKLRSNDAFESQQKEKKSSRVTRSTFGKTSFRNIGLVCVCLRLRLARDKDGRRHGTHAVETWPPADMNKWNADVKSLLLNYDHFWWFVIVRVLVVVTVPAR